MSSAAEPEIVQMLVGHGRLPVRPSERVAAEVSLLAQQVCAAYPDPFWAPKDWQEYYGSPEEAAAVEHFLHWGGGYFENQVFLLHGYTYDDSCYCGAWISLQPEAETLAERYGKSELPARLMPALERLEAEDPHAETRLRSLLCACSEGESHLLGVPTIGLAPNFVYKPAAFAYEWYKHPRRGMAASCDPAAMELRGWIDVCLKSLQGSPEPLAAEWETMNWPLQAQRSAAHAAAVEAFCALSESEQRAALRQVWVYGDDPSDDEDPPGFDQL